MTLIKIYINESIAHDMGRVVFKYDGKLIKPAAAGTDYAEFLTHFTRLAAMP